MAERASALRVPGFGAHDEAGGSICSQPKSRTSPSLPVKGHGQNKEAGLTDDQTRRRSKDQGLGFCPNPWE